MASKPSKSHDPSPGRNAEPSGPHVNPTPSGIRPAPSPHSELRNKIIGELRRDPVNVVAIVQALDDLIEQLERATSPDFSLVPKDEYARLKGIEEQYENLKMQERANAQAFEDEGRENERLREQLEALERIKDGAIAMGHEPLCGSQCAICAALYELTAVSAAPSPATNPKPTDSPFPQPALEDSEGGLFGIKTYPGKPADSAPAKERP